MLEVREVLLVILVSLTATYLRFLISVQDQNLYLMNMHLCEKMKAAYFYQEFFKFEFRQYRRNWSSHHFLGHLFV